MDFRVMKECPAFVIRLTFLDVTCQSKKNTTLIDFSVANSVKFSINKGGWLKARKDAVA